MEADHVVEMIKKLQKGEVVERGLELCLDCPMHGKYVPVIGNCYTSQIREDGKPGTGVRLHGEPSDFFHELEQKCEYALDVSFKPTSRDLKGVVCGYKANSQ
ncbi:MAG: hypothetical protein ABIH25_04715 [Candidatus Woesearchaeota archaeon]